MIKARPQGFLSVSRLGKFAVFACLWSATLPLLVHAAPTINTQPSSSSVIIGSLPAATPTTSFTVVATTSGGTLTYQWQGSTDGGSTWSNIDNGSPFFNVTSATLNVNGPAAHYTGGKVRCAVTDTNGTTTTDGLATLTITTPAPALVLAHPTNLSAFQGDVAPTNFKVLATGTSLAYQWQISTFVASSYGAFTDLNDTAPYSGVTTNTLSITDPYANLGGATASNPNRYRCIVTSGGTYAISTRFASLNIYATPAYTPTITIKVNGSPASSIASNATGTITAEVSGIPTSGSVRINRFADLNNNGVIDFGEPLVQSFTITDGRATTYGGVTNPNITGDADLTANGTIEASFVLAGSGELGRIAGNYIFRVASTTGAFKTIDSSSFAITQPGLGQSITGTVTDGTNPIPYAQVAALASNGGDSKFAGGTVADGSGNFAIAVNPGTYSVLGVAPGYVAEMDSAPSATVVTGVDSSVGNASLMAATYTNTVTLQDQTNASPLRGVQLFIQSDSGYVALASTDNNGVAVAGAVAGQWGMDMSDQSIAGFGYLRPQSNSNAGIALNATILTLPLRAANAMIYGTLKDNAGVPNPLANVDINANDQSNLYSVNTTTDAAGNYYLPVFGNGGTWNVNVDNSNPLFGTTYGAAPSANQAVSANTAYQIDLVAHAVTAHLTGTARNASTGNSPLMDAKLNLNTVAGGQTNFANSLNTDATTGAFSFGVNAGSWQIALDGNYANAHNLVAPLLAYPTVTDGNDVTGINYDVLTGTGTINGTVFDFNSVPQSGAYVSASTTIGGVTYFAGAQTDESGNYSFPVIAGSWTVSTFANNGLNFPTLPLTTITGSNLRNIGPTVFFSGVNNQTLISGGTANFNASVGTPGANTVQWEVSTDGGSTFSNVPNSAPYSGVTSNALTITGATIGLNGYKYRLAVSFTYNSVANVRRSNAGLLTVTGTAPGITLQPVSHLISAHSGTSFTITGTGSPAPSYQWKYSTDGGSTFNNLADGGSFSGSNTTTLNVSNADTTLSGYQFQCFLTNGVNPTLTSDTVILTVNALTQSINNFNDGTLALNSPTSLTVTATSSLPVAYSVVANTATYILNAGVLTITSPGTVTVRATQAGDAFYNSTFADAIFTVNKLPATVMLGNLTATYDGSPKAVTATTDHDPLTVGFTYDGSPTVPANAGSYAVIGKIADATYQGSASGTLIIAKAGQTISFTGPSTQTYGAPPLVLSATGGGSGNPVIFSVFSGPASVSGTNGSMLTLTGAGSVTVRASQAGSANYNAAPDVDKTFTVAPASGYSSWAQNKFTADELLDPNISGPNAVYGQDGLSNLVKYALGLEPKQNITTGLPKLGTTSTDWVYTFTKPTTVTDLTYEVEVSTNLTTWTITLTPTLESTDSGVETWQVTYPFSSAVNAFFRLKITQP